MSKPYPDRGRIISVLATVAEQRAYESGTAHPADIANAMANALEGAALAIEELWKRGLL